MYKIYQFYVQPFNGSYPPVELGPDPVHFGKTLCLIFTQYTKYDLKDGREWNEDAKKEYADVVIIQCRILFYWKNTDHVK